MKEFKKGQTYFAACKDGSVATLVWEGNVDDTFLERQGTVFHTMTEAKAKAEELLRARDLKNADGTQKFNNQEAAQLGMDAVVSRAFEYRVIDHDMFDADEILTMNSMGSKGWEIIRILEPMKWLNSDGMFVRIYYKREKLKNI